MPERSRLVAGTDSLASAAVVAAAGEVAAGQDDLVATPPISKPLRPKASPHRAIGCHPKPSTVLFRREAPFFRRAAPLLKRSALFRREAPFFRRRREAPASGWKLVREQAERKSKVRSRRKATTATWGPTGTRPPYGHPKNGKARSAEHPEVGTPDGIRTHVTALRGRRPRPLDDGSWTTRTLQHHRAAFPRPSAGFVADIMVREVLLGCPPCRRVTRRALTGRAARWRCR